jgi:hypothetical protein
MRNRYVALALASLLALALAVPALGGPSNPIAEGAKSAMRLAKLANKKAKQAKRKARKANRKAKQAQATADGNKAFTPVAYGFVELDGTVDPSFSEGPLPDATIRRTASTASTWSSSRSTCR